LVWTPLSETIVFGRSISAGYSCAPHKGPSCHHDKDNCCEDAQLALIRDLVTDSHYHDNLEALHLIGIDGDGGLTIGGQPLIQLASILARLDAIESAMDGAVAALDPKEGGLS